MALLDGRWCWFETQEWVPAQVGFWVGQVNEEERVEMVDENTMSGLGPGSAQVDPIGFGYSRSLLHEWIGDQDGVPVGG